MIYTAVSTASELNGSRTETSSVGKSGIVEQTNITLRVPYVDASAVISDILINARVDPLKPNRYATNIQLNQPQGEDSGYSTSGQAIIPDYVYLQVTYSTPDPDKEDDPKNEEIVTETLETHHEFVTLDYTLFQWGKDEDLNMDPDGAPISPRRPLKPNEAPGRLLSSLTLNRDWKKVPGPLPNQFLTFPGCVNAATYFSRFLSLSFPKESLLYGGATVTRAIRLDEIPALNVNTKFLVRWNGWNRYWNAESGRYEMIYTRRRRVKPGSTTDFETIEPQPYKSYPPVNLGPILGWV